MEMLFLLKNLYRDPLALSRFSQFRCLHISKGEIIQNLNETHEFRSSLFCSKRVIMPIQRSYRIHASDGNAE